MTQVTCNKCGWVAFEVTREHAERSVLEFNTWFDTQTPEVQAMDGGKGLSIRIYERCHFCGGPYTDFRESREGDCPDGCTLCPIICRDQHKV